MPSRAGSEAQQAAEAAEAAPLPLLLRHTVLLGWVVCYRLGSSSSSHEIGISNLEMFEILLRFFEMS